VVLSKVLSFGEGKELRRCQAMVPEINAFEAAMQQRSDAELRQLTDIFRKRLADGQTLDDLLPEAFAAVREASVRTLGKRHFDVQLVGGVALHGGHIAEMKTGEGKTLTSTLPAYLNALTGEGVHIVTVNDYLAKRDAEWMGVIHRFLGLEVGVVLIVDEFTGRVVEGRRYSEGLHQAIEAKESVPIKEENQTYATITLQNYFRMYDKIAGMTGTAKTEAAEFNHIYKLGVVEVPTNKPMIRQDHGDVIYKTEQAKFEALVDEIAERHERGQPMLVGTVSIEKSERVNRLLEKRGIKAEILNAKHHEREAHIIAQAGRLGAVTVATNMAGRGVDIMLGGNVEYLAEESLRAKGMDPLETPPEEWNSARQAAIEEKTRQVADEHQQVVDRGGLAVLGTERHESRRIDNQLRGRSGRQGDPGESRFYLSLEDDLMRMFATKTVGNLMERLSLPDDVPITHRLVTRAIANAQRQVESQNFERRKNVLKYDEVMNKQRQVIYDTRRRVLEGGDELRDQTLGFLGDAVTGLVAEYCPQGVYPEEWDIEGLFKAISQLYPTQVDPDSLDLDSLDHNEFENLLLDDAERAYKDREAEFGGDLLHALERRVLLTVLDRHWREHLYEMDYLQEGIGLRAIGQRDPLVEYQREGFDMFVAMQDSIKREAVAYVFNASVQVIDEEAERRQAPAPQPTQLSSAVTEAEERAASTQPQRQGVKKVGRNQPCPCGSGKKYKLCHGAATPRP
jgi:preprotein translocase subunit SecA